MEYKKIAERLVNYKISKGEKIPFYGIKNSECEGCTICPVYKSLEEDKENWVNDLEIIVKKRHSKFKFVRKLSRLK